MTVLTMSVTEVSRFEALVRAERGEVRVADPMFLLRLQRRHVYRLLERLKQDGAPGVISRRRGPQSNRRLSDTFRDEVAGPVRERYADFGPKLAAGYLAERYGITVSYETLRQIMMAAAL